MFEWVAGFAILAFIPMWIGVNYFNYRFGGWASLGKVYRFSGSFNGDRWRRQWVRTVSDYTCVTVGANTHGLYCSVPSLFRAGHPPLFIPWSDISVSLDKGFLFTYLGFRLRRAPGIPFRISKSLGQEIARAAGSAWPGEDALPR